MKLGIIALTAAALLSGCSQELSKVPVQGKSLILPDVINYPESTQHEAAKEMIGGSCPVLSDVFMPDYGVMRDQTRIAKKELK